MQFFFATLTVILRIPPLGYETRKRPAIPNTDAVMEAVILARGEEPSRPPDLTNVRQSPQVKKKDACLGDREAQVQVWSDAGAHLTFRLTLDFVAQDVAYHQLS
jgi:hypothetical protein